MSRRSSRCKKRPGNDRLCHQSVTSGARGRKLSPDNRTYGRFPIHGQYRNQQAAFRLNRKRAEIRPPQNTRNFQRKVHGRAFGTKAM
jgi:hypothetical protein